MYQDVSANYAIERIGVGKGVEGDQKGGRQVVTVQHVNISGGQAIVAGAVSATGGAFAGGDHDSAQ